MTDVASAKRAVITGLQRRIGNPIARRFGGQQLVETIGRTSGEPRVTPVSARIIDGDFWFVSEFGDHSQYIKNIKVNPRVRVRHKGVWHTGIAYPMYDDDVGARLAQLSFRVRSAVRAAGTDLLSVKIVFQ